MAAPSLVSEDLLSFAAATRAIPTRPAICTIWRWASRGVRGVRLETTKIGGRKFTSSQAIERFLAKINGEAVEPTTSKKRQGQIERAEAELAEAGM